MKFSRSQHVLCTGLSPVRSVFSITYKQGRPLPHFHQVQGFFIEYLPWPRPWCPMQTPTCLRNGNLPAKKKKNLSSGLILAPGVPFLTVITKWILKEDTAILIDCPLRVELSPLVCWYIMGGDWGPDFSFLVSSHFPALNIPTVLDFKLPVWHHWTWIWKQMHAISNKNWLQHITNIPPPQTPHFQTDPHWLELWSLTVLEWVWGQKREAAGKKH